MWEKLGGWNGCWNKNSMHEDFVNNRKIVKLEENCIIMWATKWCWEIQNVFMKKNVKIATFLFLALCNYGKRQRKTENTILKQLYHMALQRIQDFFLKMAEPTTTNSTIRFRTSYIPLQVMVKTVSKFDRCR